MFTENANRIFNRVIEEYHRWDDVDRPVENPYEPGTIDHLLYHKNWIDTVQWHLEDIIRDPQIDPVAALAIKRRIDKSNQERTDMVEYVDSYLLDKYREIEPLPGVGSIPRPRRGPSTGYRFWRSRFTTWPARRSVPMWTTPTARRAGRSSTCCWRSRRIFRKRSKS